MNKDEKTVGTLHVYEPEQEEPEAEAMMSGPEEPVTGPIPVDPAEYEEPAAEPEGPEQDSGQSPTDGDAPPDLSGMLQLLAFTVAQMRYRERERQQRFIEAWLGEVGPIMEMLRIPEALAAMGWTAARGLEALPPWVRLALAGAWMAYAFKAADAEAKKGVVENETLMDVDTGTTDGRRL